MINSLVQVKTSWGTNQKIGFSAELREMGVFRHVLTSPFSGNLNLGEIGLCLVFELPRMTLIRSVEDYEILLIWARTWVNPEIVALILDEWEIFATTGIGENTPIFLGRWVDLEGWRLGCIWSPGRKGRPILKDLLKDEFPGSAKLGEESKMFNVRSLVKRDIFTGLFTFEVWTV